jgi:hypothetical protein
MAASIAEPTLPTQHDGIGSATAVDVGQTVDSLAAVVSDMWCHTADAARQALCCAQLADIISLDTKGVERDTADEGEDIVAATACQLGVVSRALEAITLHHACVDVVIPACTALQNLGRRSPTARLQVWG